jgi:hypothetical protein
MKLSKTERINRFLIQNLNSKFYRPKLVSRLISDSKFKSQNLMNQNHDHIFKYHGHRFLIFLFNFFDFVNHDHISSNSASLGRPPALGTSNMITDNKSSPSDSSVNYRRTPAPPPTRWDPALLPSVPLRAAGRRAPAAPCHAAPAERATPPIPCLLPCTALHEQQPPCTSTDYTTHPDSGTMGVAPWLGISRNTQLYFAKKIY